MYRCIQCNVNSIVYCGQLRQQQNFKKSEKSDKDNNGKKELNDKSTCVNKNIPISAL